MPETPPRPSPSPRPQADRLDELDGLEEPSTDPRIQPALQRHDWKNLVRSIVISGGMLITALVSMLIFVDNRVAAQTDAGVKVHESRLGALEQQRAGDRAENNGRFERIENSQQRTEKKLDALLDRLDVRNPAPTPVPTKDGGP